MTMNHPKYLDDQDLFLLQKPVDKHNRHWYKYMSTNSPYHNNEIKKKTNRPQSATNLLHRNNTTLYKAKPMTRQMSEEEYQRLKIKTYFIKKDDYNSSDGILRWPDDKLRNKYNTTKHDIVDQEINIKKELLVQFDDPKNIVFNDNKNNNNKKKKKKNQNNIDKAVKQSNLPEITSIDKERYIQQFIDSRNNLFQSNSNVTLNNTNIYHLYKIDNDNDRYKKPYNPYITKLESLEELKKNLSKHTNHNIKINNKLKSDKKYDKHGLNSMLSPFALNNNININNDNNNKEDDIINIIPSNDDIILPNNHHHPNLLSMKYINALNTFDSIPNVTTLSNEFIGKSLYEIANSSQEDYVMKSAKILLSLEKHIEYDKLLNIEYANQLYQIQEQK